MSDLCSLFNLEGGFVPCAEYGHERRMGATYLGRQPFSPQLLSQQMPMVALCCAVVLGGDGRIWVTQICAALLEV